MQVERGDPMIDIETWVLAQERIYLDLDHPLVANGWVTRGLPASKLGITVGNDC